MAKKSKIAKTNEQIALVEKYSDLRYKLKENNDYEALRQLPKNSNPNRFTNRDNLDGNARSYMRKFGLSRHNFRKYAHNGQIPGVKKASW